MVQIFSYIKLFLYYIIRLYSMALVVYCVLSWFIHDPYNKIYQFFAKLCDPLLNPIRFVLRKIPFANKIPTDLSPIFLIILINILQMVIFLI